ncbi:uncharacterized protein SPAPADRAFT_50253 [Spathaspora passalidarum NRRL Y-27907]|uniref:CID domain-containing protein n=1 Tax=Spathaspora passalidarum (strain NRRL Y-27907 / 11-Y1) TaxID=619300 RepID=G3AM12_SPAPN|nr:uncharacterized protein SPAPADRAFT_50253 [Spathaspora passalidarum NRRL Y-27907]EGW33365.1 hypothetical protein SPAPADRAFT_50253 [Spathaspora passalidarum NRRL Y-27907]
MAGDEFDAEYYKSLLNSLTINSRAVITELTSLAEEHIDNSMEITKMIEDRIKRCVPKQKLFAFYLMDSIVKNIGNPYNIIFSQNLFKTFVETYSLVTDTPTRQSLINLFRTWMSGKNSGGGEIFPAAVLAKIEKFIIQATTIQGGGSSIINQTTISDGIPTSKLTPDMLLREGRSLLHYVITLDKALDKKIDENKQYLDKKDEDFKFVHEIEIRRNLLVSIINETMDSVYFDVQGSNDDTKSLGAFTVQNNKFEDHVAKYQTDLKSVRKELDEHSYQQDQFLKKFDVKIKELISKEKLKEEKLKAKQKIFQYLEDNKVVIDYQPDIDYFSNITRDIHKDPKFVSLINRWGKTPVYRQENKSGQNKRDEKQNERDNGNKSEGNSLGFNFGSIDFNELSSNDSEPSSTLLSSSLGSSFLLGSNSNDNDDDDEDQEEQEEENAHDNPLFTRIRPPTPPPRSLTIGSSVEESPKKLSFNDYKQHKSVLASAPIESMATPPPRPPLQHEITVERKSSLKKRSIGGDFNRVVKKVRFDI